MLVNSEYIAFPERELGLATDCLANKIRDKCAYGHHCTGLAAILYNTHEMLISKPAGSGGGALSQDLAKTTFTRVNLNIIVSAYNYTQIFQTCA